MREYKLATYEQDLKKIHSA